jgi:hypothetical protein
MEFINQFLQNPILNGLGFILGLISLILGYIFYREGLRLKKPFWNIRSNNLVQDFSSALSDLTIAYKGEKVENITISRIIFWNGGKDTINASDIPRTDPLKIVATANNVLLDIQLLSTNSAPSSFSVSLQPDKTCALLNFEYLDYSQGAILQIIHTGTSSSHLSIVGTVKGTKVRKKYLTPADRLPLPTPKEIDDLILKRFSPPTRRRIIAMVSYLIIMLTFISAFLLIIPWASINPYKTTLGFSTLVLGICSFFAIGFTINKQNLLPPGLETYFDEMLN